MKTLYAVGGLIVSGIAIYAGIAFSNATPATSDTSNNTVTPIDPTIPPITTGKTTLQTTPQPPPSPVVPKPSKPHVNKGDTLKHPTTRQKMHNL